MVPKFSRFEPATEDDEGLSFPMKIEVSMIKYEMYTLRGTYLLVSLGRRLTNKQQRIRP